MHTKMLIQFLCTDCNKNILIQKLESYFFHAHDCIYKNISYVLLYKTQISFTFILFDNTFSFIRKVDNSKIENISFAFESKVTKRKKKKHLNYLSDKLKLYFYLTKI